MLAPSQPELAAATGALLLASRRDQLDLRTRTSIGLLTAAAGTSVIELPAGDVMVIDADAMTDRELAWSQTEFPGEASSRLGLDIYNDEDDGPSPWSMRLNLIEPPPKARRLRLRLSQMVIGLCSVVAVTAIGGVAYTLTGIENREAPVVPNIAPLPVPPSSIAPSPVSPPPSAAPSPRNPQHRAAAPAITVAATAGGGDHHRAAAGRNHHCAADHHDDAPDHHDHPAANDDHHDTADYDDHHDDAADYHDHHDDRSDDHRVVAHPAGTGADTGSGSAEPGSDSAIPGAGSAESAEPLPGSRRLLKP